MNLTFRTFAFVSLISIAGGVRSEEVPILRNGSFDEGSRFWFILTKGEYRKPETLGKSLEVRKGKGLYLNISELVVTDTAKPAAVTVNQRLKQLKDGTTYTLGFEIRSSVKGSCLVGLGNPVKEGPNKFNLAGGLPVNTLTVMPRWEEHSFSFTYNKEKHLSLPEDAEHTLLQFRLGTLQDVTLRHIHLTPASALP